MDKISSCCGAYPGEIDVEICRCPECGEPCDFVTPCHNETCDNDAMEGEVFCKECFKKEEQNA